MENGFIEAGAYFSMRFAVRVHAWIQSSILVCTTPFWRQKLAKIADRLQVRIVYAPRAVEYQANLEPFDTTQTPSTELENTLIRLCRELPPIVAAVECPPATRTN